MKFKWYEIPYGEEVEIVNKDSRHFRKRGIVETSDPDGIGCSIRFDNNEYDMLCWEEIIPVQNILKITDLQPETLAQIFNQNYLYETNRVIISFRKFSCEEVENAYEELARKLADGEGRCDNAEYVLALLDSMLGYDEEEFETPIEEMITFVQWWVEGLRKHVTSGNKNRRYFETKLFKIEFIYLD